MGRIKVIELTKPQREELEDGYRNGKTHSFRQRCQMISHNEGDKSNHWITLELGAKQGNPLAIGTGIKVMTGKVVQTEEIRSGGSYLSQNDLRVHFGLGKAAKADEIEIRWNSGKVETIKNVAADKFYGVSEGEGIVSVEKIRPKIKK